MSASFKDFESSKENGSEFIPLADMMTILMLIFMFIAVITVRHSIKKSETVRQVAVAYEERQKQLYTDLHAEFAADLKKWDAYIDKEKLSIVFQSPDLLFALNKSRITPQFASVLSDFFPRFINLIYTKYRNDIMEIRIEGYTDSLGNSRFTPLQNYMYNMRLSQNRTRNVLSYCMTLPEMKGRFDWMKLYVTANGLSSSHLKYKADGTEDSIKSRRVEFRINTKADMEIRRIIETLDVLNKNKDKTNNKAKQAAKIDQQPMLQKSLVPVPIESDKAIDKASNSSTKLSSTKPPTKTVKVKTVKRIKQIIKT